ncbi:hypothetical protein SAMN05444722_2746 [Rhodovulum sp. ES.010]|uniref:hypothetical protein n=1 Tax=Rhodovulum sp. ES.010 TaxID=1882821 RepID=UPI000928D0F8|nr:hypothetical protein [Rhodovulum sp. ES.010]SIO49944.1 hypothetical protein SAMN05444722_2746 [Rhodovulum sp. ES.010]
MTQADPLEELLLRERTALRRADFKALPAIAAEKERAVAELERHPITDADTLARLREMAARNAELLAAMRRGVDSAAASLKRARAPAEPLTTYGPGGQSAAIGAVNRAVTRRA